MKFETIEHNEVTKFEKIWSMREEHIFEMVKKLIDADCIIQEQLLGWTWLPPSEAIFKFETKTLGSDARSNLDSSILADSNDNGIDDEVREHIQ